MLRLFQTVTSEDVCRRNTKRQVNELCFPTYALLPCFSPQFAFYFLSSYDGKRKRVSTVRSWFCRGVSRDVRDSSSKTTRTNPKIPEDARSLPTIAERETALTFPSPSLRTCIAKRDLAPNALHLKKEISSFAHRFHFFTSAWVYIASSFVWKPTHLEFQIYGHSYDRVYRKMYTCMYLMIYDIFIGQKC